MRQAIAVVALIIVIVLIAIGVNSCQSSSNKTSLQDYGNDVNSVLTSSQSSSTKLFAALEGGVNSTNAQQTEQTINTIESSARADLTRAQGFSVPGSAKSAQTWLVQALQLRLDGVTNIANDIQPAVGTSESTSAVNDIAAQMAQFYASDVDYKLHAAPLLVEALHGAGVQVSTNGGSGVPVYAEQFLPSIKWLEPATVASVLNVSLASSSGGSSGKNGTGGLRGSELQSVAVGSTTLTSAATNTVDRSPTPSFKLTFLDSGNFNEYDVKCKVTITGTSVSGTATVPETFTGKTSTCTVPLSSTPPSGEYSVVAEVEPVPGEKNTSNNSLTYSVEFQ